MYTVDTKELKHLMIDAGFSTIEALAEASNINRNTLSDVLNGKTYPSSIVMKKLAEALHMSSDVCGKVFFVKELA